MSDRTISRRGVLRTIGAAAATTAVVGAGPAAADSPWTTAETPVDATIHDVEYADGDAYAVAGGGVVIERQGSGEEPDWTQVIGGGPTGNGNDLYGADPTDAGRGLWFVGASGAIGEYDVRRGVLDDHSAPDDVTNNFNDVAATGQRDEANVYVAGDSGKIYYSFADGATGTWDSVTPGSGSAITAIDFYSARMGVAVDTNGAVFETTDGETWSEIGIPDANVNFYGVDANYGDDVYVSGGGGMVFAYDGRRWEPSDTGDAGLRDVEVGIGGDGLAVGGGGTLYARDDEAWSAIDSPTGSNLRAVVRGDPDVAVGAGGTVVERR